MPIQIIFYTSIWNQSENLIWQESAQYQIHQDQFFKSINIKNRLIFFSSFDFPLSSLSKVKKRQKSGNSVNFIIILFEVEVAKSMKKVHPLEISNSSISNISTNEALDNSILQLCRFCKKSNQMQDPELKFIVPCTCQKPIHKACLPGQMRESAKNKMRRARTSDKQQRYNCPKCVEVIRFTDVQELKCRNGKEVCEFIKQNRCLCTGLSIATFLTCGMLIFLIAIKSSSFQISNQVMLQSAVIGFSIAIAVISLIVLYFFVSEVLIKISHKIELITRKEGTKKERISQPIIIENCS